MEIPEGDFIFVVKLERGKGNLTPQTLHSLLNKKRMELEK